MKAVVPVNRTLIWLILAAVLVIGFLLFRSRSRNNLDITLDAKRELEKAKRR